MTEQNTPELERIRQTAREVIEKGSEVRNQIRDITLNALKAGQLEAERIKKVVETVGEGALSGMASDVEDSKRILSEACAGIDDALATGAQATQLTLEEAQQRVKHFAEQDLAKGKADLKDLESLFLDTLGELAKRSQTSATQLLTDVRDHAQASGTAVGKQITSTVSEAAEELKRKGKTNINHVLNTAFSTSEHFAQVASGVLANLAEKLRDPKGEKKQESEEG
jgi:predicted DNA-binding ribbon-helix-helix protein